MRYAIAAYTDPAAHNGVVQRRAATHADVAKVYSVVFCCTIDHANGVSSSTTSDYACAIDDDTTADIGSVYEAAIARVDTSKNRASQHL